MKKRMFAAFLAVLMVLTATACGSAPHTAQAETPAATAAPAASAAPTVLTQTALSDIDGQLALIHSQIDKLLQKGGTLTWYYTVTDLDHNGRIEFIAAAQHPQDRSTNLKIWEVTADRGSLTECKVLKDEDESFPDIMTDSADTFYTKSSDTWDYLFYDNVVVSDLELYTSKSAFHLKDGVVSYQAFAVEHTVVQNNQRKVTHTNTFGKDLTDAEYNAAGVDAFANASRTSTGFDWFTADQTPTLNRLVDSLLVFMGMKKAPDKFPVPAPAVEQYPLAPSASPAPTPAPAPAPTPAPQPTYLTITKNPTNETKRSGETALFIAAANVYDSITWTMVSPQGGEFSTGSFANMFPGSPVSGIYGTTLSVGNVTWDMDGWGAYCTFYYRGQVARTSTAYIFLKSDPVPPSPTSGTSYGTVVDWNYSTVTVNGSDIGNLVISNDLCDIDGDLYNGAPATVNWVSYGSGINVTYCHIDGQHQVGPIQGSMSGTAHEGGAGYAINLQNGTQVFLDSWRCNVEGQFYDGCSAVVYYYNYPSEDNIYQCDIYGNMGLLVPDDQTDGDGGGWAGSHYYDNENDADRGGWAGSHYYDSMGMTGNSVPTQYGDLPTHASQNGDGSSYEAFWCPNCGAEVSLAQGECPSCGLSF